MALDRSRLRAFAHRALANGATRTSIGSIHYVVDKRCSQPVTRHYGGYPNPYGEGSDAPMPREAYWAPGKENPILMTVEAPCRQCSHCLRKRATYWRIRAMEEIAASTRTWFGTLTLSPDNHYLMMLRASKGIDFHALSVPEQLRARHNEISKEITKYFKRVRKKSGAVIRYLLVLEQHKSGLPHYHMLIHEVLPDSKVTKRLLSEQWSLGFTNFRLVENSKKTANYVAKYLSKSALARVRASKHYGETRTIFIRGDEIDVKQLTPNQNLKF